MTGQWYEQWAREGKVLGRIGRALFSQPTRVTVRLPRALADEALLAWVTDDYLETESGPRLPVETMEQRDIRDRARALALIGFDVECRGVVDGEVVVAIDAWEIGKTFSAAEEDGLLRDVDRPRAD